MDNQLISENLTEQNLQYIKNSLQAHDSDLNDEIRTNSRGKTQMVIQICLNKLGEDLFTDVTVSIPRERLKVKTSFGKQRTLF